MICILIIWNMLPKNLWFMEKIFTEMKKIRNKISFIWEFVNDTNRPFWCTFYLCQKLVLHKIFTKTLNKLYLVCVEEGTKIERKLLRIMLDNMLLHPMFTWTNGCLHENTWCLKSNHNNWNKVLFTRFYFIFGMVHTVWTIWYDMLDIQILLHFRSTNFQIKVTKI